MVLPELLADVLAYDSMRDVTPTMAAIRQEKEWSKSYAVSPVNEEVPSLESKVQEPSVILTLGGSRTAPTTSLFFFASFAPRVRDPLR